MKPLSDMILLRGASMQKFIQPPLNINSGSSNQLIKEYMSRSTEAALQ
jgi:hypothetical protein